MPVLIVDTSSPILDDLPLLGAYLNDRYRDAGQLDSTPYRVLIERERVADAPVDPRWSFPCPGGSQTHPPERASR